jgi:cobalamin-dependent methionine synthase I
MQSDSLIIIGENFNATRKIVATSPRVIRDGDKLAIGYVDLDGNKRILDCTDTVPEDPAKRKNFMIPHIAQAVRKKDLNYIAWAIKNQERHGAHIIDLCVDEISGDPAERNDWIRWLVKTAQSITNSIIAIDSSDPKTVLAGLEVHDSSKSRPAVNSFNLEPARRELVPLAKERNAYLFANATGANGMPSNATERIDNMAQCMEIMEAEGIAAEDCFLDPLVFPVGAGSEYGSYYLDAVRELRARYPQVHIFGGHSNVSFGLPNRRLLNNVFSQLSILAGCDTLMVDPITVPPAEMNAFHFASKALTGKDEYSMEYIKYARSQLSGN